MRQENLKNNRDILLETRNLSVEFPLKKKSFFENKKYCLPYRTYPYKSGREKRLDWSVRAAAANQRLPMQRLVL